LQSGSGQDTRAAQHFYQKERPTYSECLTAAEAGGVFFFLQEDQTLLSALEACSEEALGSRSWMSRLDPDFLENLGRYRKYRPHSLRDLLRVIRNKHNHFRELPEPLQAKLGPLPDGFLKCVRLLPAARLPPSTLVALLSVLALTCMPVAGLVTPGFWSLLSLFATRFHFPEA
jgi:hypothetical protein